VKNWLIRDWFIGDWGMVDWEIGRLGKLEDWGNWKIEKLPPFCHRFADFLY
jgi:hypothetical protein